MHLNQFVYLNEIGLTHSINAAAHNLGVTQQSLSRAVRNLEDELGFVILDRSPTGVTFTTQGQKVLTAARTISDALVELRESVQGNTVPGVLRYGSTHTVYDNYISLTLRWFREKYPDITPERTIDGLERLLEELSKGAIDFVLATYTSIDGERGFDLPAGLALYEVSRLRLYATLNPQHPCAHMTAPSLRTLCRYPIVLGPDAAAPDSPIRQLLNKKYSLAKIIESNNNVSVQGYIQHGLGWSLLPLLSTTMYLENVTSLATQEYVETVVCCFVRAKAILPPEADAFIRHFAAHANPAAQI